jgi:hypothetical protein
VIAFNAMAMFRPALYDLMEWTPGGEIVAAGGSLGGGPPAGGASCGDGRGAKPEGRIKLSIRSCQR